MKIELNPWLVPDEVIIRIPPGKRQDGFSPSSFPKLKLSDLDPETIAEQCDRFREDVFRKADKNDPAKKNP